MTQTQLARCPFCGGEAVLKHWPQTETDEEENWVGCSNAACWVGDAYSSVKSVAIAAWNRRAESAELAALRQQVATLEAQVAELQAMLSEGRAATEERDERS